MIQARPINTIQTKALEKIQTGIVGFDNLVGGGLVPGSTMLFAGEPGVGKSTLLLQLANVFAKHHRVLYVSGEESMSQIKMRADRLHAVNPQIFCSENIALEDVILLIEQTQPKLLILDSLQMIYSRSSKLMPGSPSQMKKVLLKLIEVAKAKDIILITIGHSTKSGMIAGLLTLQHMVDATMFMSCAEDGIRLLEVKKNRFGASQEIWEMEMEEHGFKGINETVSIFENSGEIAEKLENSIFGVRNGGGGDGDGEIFSIIFKGLGLTVSFIGAISILLFNLIKSVMPKKKYGGHKKS